jgi:hypothetical protein
MADDLVYHHTDTVHLPWILHAHALNPGRGMTGGFPEPDFLWATTDARGDPSSTSAIHSRKAIRIGYALAVRLTLAVPRTATER